MGGVVAVVARSEKGAGDSIPEAASVEPESVIIDGAFGSLRSTDERLACTLLQGQVAKASDNCSNSRDCERLGHVDHRVRTLSPTSHWGRLDSAT